MAGQRKTTEQQLEALRQKQDALKAKLSALETQKKAEDRRRETRRAFVVGAAVLSRAEADPSFRDALRDALQAVSMREGDRTVIADLLGLQTPSPLPTPAELPVNSEAA